MCKSQFIGIVLFFLLIPSEDLFSQVSISYQEVDSQTYRHYTDSSWDPLIEIGNKAIDNGIDYYYLRLRMGIAYYNKKKFRLAAFHLENALKLNSGDQVGREYLYYSYLFSDQFELARKLSLSFNKDLKSKTGSEKLPRVDFFNFEGAIRLNDNEDFDNASYFQFGIGHYAKNRFSLFHAVTVYKAEDYRGKLDQFQYYFRPGIPIKNNWLFSPAIHLVQTNYVTTAKSGNTRPPGSDPVDFQSVEYRTINSSYSFELKRQMKKVEVSIGSGLAFINSESQIQHNFGLSLYPFGNSKVSIGSLVYIFTQNQYGEISRAFTPNITLRPLKFLAFSSGYFKNYGVNNVIEANGYLFNNSLDPTINRYFFSFNFYLGKKVEIYTIYQVENKMEESNSNQYKYSSYMGGIKIKP